MYLPRENGARTKEHRTLRNECPRKSQGVGPAVPSNSLLNFRLSSVYAAGGRVALMRKTFAASRIDHEHKLLANPRGRRFDAYWRRLRPGKENQAVGPSACCRKDGGSAECRSNHSRILHGKRKGANPLRSGNDRQRP